METYYPEIVGGARAFVRVKALPEFNDETDIGRVIYVKYDDAYYFGTANGWYGLGPYGPTGGSGETGASGGTGLQGESGGSGGSGITGATGGADTACCYKIAVNDILTKNVHEDFYQEFETLLIKHSLATNYYFINIFNTDGTEVLLKDNQITDKTTKDFIVNELKGYLYTGNIVVTEAICGNSPAPYRREQHDSGTTWTINVDVRILDVENTEVYYYTIFGELLDPVSVTVINASQYEVEFDRCVTGYSFIWADANPDYSSLGILTFGGDHDAELLVGDPLHEWVLVHNFNVEDPELNMTFNVYNSDGSICKRFDYDFEKYRTKDDFMDAKGLSVYHPPSRRSDLGGVDVPFQDRFVEYKHPFAEDFTDCLTTGSGGTGGVGDPGEGDPILSPLDLPFTKDGLVFDDTKTVELKPPFNNYQNGSSNVFEDNLGYVVKSIQPTYLKLIFFKFLKESLPIPTVHTGKLTAHYNDAFKIKTHNIPIKKTNEFIHVQQISSSVWIINHNLSSTNLRVNLVLNNDNCKYLVCYLNPNKVKIYFFRYDHENLAGDDVDFQKSEAMIPANVQLVKRRGHVYLFRAIQLRGYDISDTPGYSYYPEGGRVLVYTGYYPVLSPEEISRRAKLKHFPIQSLIAKEYELDLDTNEVTIRHNLGTRENLVVEFYEITDVDKMELVEPDFMFYESEDVIRLYFTSPAEDEFSPQENRVQNLDPMRGVVKIYEMLTDDVISPLLNIPKVQHYKNIVPQTFYNHKHTFTHKNTIKSNIWNINHNLIIDNLDLYKYLINDNDILNIQKSCCNSVSTNCSKLLPYSINILRSSLYYPKDFIPEVDIDGRPIPFDECECIIDKGRILNIDYVSNTEVAIEFSEPLSGEITFSIDLPLESLVSMDDRCSDENKMSYQHVQHLKSHVWYVNHNMNTLNPSVYAMCDGVPESFSFNDLATKQCRAPVPVRVYPKVEVLNENKIKLIFQQVLSYSGAAIITVKEEALYNQLRLLPWLIFGEGDPQGDNNGINVDFENYSKQDIIDFREDFNNRFVKRGEMPTKPSNLMFQALDNYGESVAPDANAVYLSENAIELDFKNLLYLQNRLLNGFSIIRSVDVQYDPTRIDSQTVQIYDQSREPEYLTISTPTVGKAYVTDGNLNALRSPLHTIDSSAIFVPPSKYWIIKHDFNTTDLSIRCFDPLGYPIWPEAIDYVSENEIHITLSFIPVLSDDGTYVEQSWIDEPPERWEKDNYDVMSRLIIRKVSNTWPQRNESFFMYQHNVETWKQYVERTEGDPDYIRRAASEGSNDWPDTYWKIRHNLNTRYPKLSFFHDDGSEMAFDGTNGIDYPPFRIYYVNEQYLEIMWLPSDPAFNPSMMTPGRVLVQRIIRPDEYLLDSCYDLLAGTGGTGGTGGSGWTGGTGKTITGGTGATGPSMYEGPRDALPPDGDYIRVESPSLLPIMMDQYAPLSSECGCFQYQAPAGSYVTANTTSELVAFKASEIEGSECLISADCLMNHTWGTHFYMYEGQSTIDNADIIMPNGGANHWVYNIEYYTSSSTSPRMYWDGDPLFPGDDSRYNYLCYFLSSNGTGNILDPWALANTPSNGRYFTANLTAVYCSNLPPESTVAWNEWDSGDGALFAIIGYVAGHTISMVAHMHYANESNNNETTNGVGLYYDYGLPTQELLMDYPYSGYASNADFIRTSQGAWSGIAAIVRFIINACVSEVGTVTVRCSDWGGGIFNEKIFFDLTSDPKTEVFLSQCQFGWGSIGVNRACCYAHVMLEPTFTVPSTVTIPKIIWDQRIGENQYWEWSGVPDCEWVATPALCIPESATPPALWDVETNEYYYWEGVPTCDWVGTGGILDDIRCPPGVGGIGGTGGSGGTGRRNTVSFEAGCCPLDFDGVDGMQSNFGTSVLRFEPDYPNNHDRIIVFDQGFNAIPCLTEIFKENMEEDGLTPVNMEKEAFINPTTDYQWQYARYAYSIDRGGTRIGVKMMPDAYRDGGGECIKDHQLQAMDADDADFLMQREQMLDYQSRKLFQFVRSPDNNKMFGMIQNTTWEHVLIRDMEDVTYSPEFTTNFRSYLRYDHGIAREYWDLDGPPMQPYSGYDPDVSGPWVPPDNDPITTDIVEGLQLIRLYPTTLKDREFVVQFRGDNELNIELPYHELDDGSVKFHRTSGLQLIIAYKVVNGTTHTLSIIRRKTKTNFGQHRPMGPTFFLVYNYGLRGEKFLYENLVIGTKLGVDNGACGSWIQIPATEFKAAVVNAVAVKMSVARIGDKIRFNSTVFNALGDEYQDPDVVIDLNNYPVLDVFLNEEDQYIGYGCASIQSIYVDLELYSIHTSSHDIPDICDEHSGGLWTWNPVNWHWLYTPGRCCRTSDYRFLAAHSTLRYYDISWYGQWYYDNPNDIYDASSLVGFTGHSGHEDIEGEAWPEEVLQVLDDPYFEKIEKIYGGLGQWAWCDRFDNITSPSYNLEYDVQDYMPNWLLSQHTIYPTKLIDPPRPPSYGVETRIKPRAYGCRKRTVDKFTGEIRYDFCAAYSVHDPLTDGVFCTIGTVWAVIVETGFTLHVLEPQNNAWIPCHAQFIIDTYGSFEQFLTSLPDSHYTYWYCSGSFTMWTYEPIWVQKIKKDGYHDYWELRGGARHWTSYRRYLRDTFLTRVDELDAPGCKTEAHDNDLWWVWTGNTGMSPQHFEGSGPKSTAPNPPAPPYFIIDTEAVAGLGDGPGMNMHWIKDVAGRSVWVKKYVSKIESTDSQYPSTAYRDFVIPDWEYTSFDPPTSVKQQVYDDVIIYQYVYWPLPGSPDGSLIIEPDTEDPNVVLEWDTTSQTHIEVERTPGVTNLEVINSPSKQYYLDEFGATQYSHNLMLMWFKNVTGDDDDHRTIIFDDQRTDRSYPPDMDYDLSGHGIVYESVLSEPIYDTTSPIDCFVETAAHVFNQAEIDKYTQAQIIKSDICELGYIPTESGIQYVDVINEAVDATKYELCLIDDECFTGCRSKVIDVDNTEITLETIANTWRKYATTAVYSMFDHPHNPFFDYDHVNGILRFKKDWTENSIGVYQDPEFLVSMNMQIISPDKYEHYRMSAVIGIGTNYVYLNQNLKWYGGGFGVSVEIAGGKVSSQAVILHMDFTGQPEMNVIGYFNLGGPFAVGQHIRMTYESQDPPYWVEYVDPEDPNPPVIEEDSGWFYRLLVCRDGNQITYHTSDYGGVNDPLPLVHTNTFIINTVHPNIPNVLVDAQHISLYAFKRSDISFRQFYFSTDIETDPTPIDPSLIPSIHDIDRNQWWRWVTDPMCRWERYDGERLIDYTGYDSTSLVLFDEWGEIVDGYKWDEDSCNYIPCDNLIDDREIIVGYKWVDYGPVMTNKSGFVWDQWQNVDHRNINVCQKLAIDTYVENDGKDLYFEFSNALTGDPVNIWWQVINRPEKIEIVVTYMYLHENRWLRVLDDPEHSGVIGTVASLEDSWVGPSGGLPVPQPPPEWSCDIDNAIIILDPVADVEHYKEMALAVSPSCADAPANTQSGYHYIETSNVQNVKDELQATDCWCFPSCSCPDYCLIENNEYTLQDVYDTWDVYNSSHRPDEDDAITREEMWSFDTTSNVLRARDDYQYPKYVEAGIYKEPDTYDTRGVTIFSPFKTDTYKMSVVVNCNSRYYAVDEFGNITSQLELVAGCVIAMTDVLYPTINGREFLSLERHMYTHLNNDGSILEEGSWRLYMNRCNDINGVSRAGGTTGHILAPIPDPFDPFWIDEGSDDDTGWYTRISVCRNGNDFSLKCSQFGHKDDPLPIDDSTEIKFTVSPSSHYYHKFSGPQHVGLSAFGRGDWRFRDFCFQNSLDNSAVQGEAEISRIHDSIADEWWRWNSVTCSWELYTGEIIIVPTPFDLNPLVYQDEEGNMRAWYWNTATCNYDECVYE